MKKTLALLIPLACVLVFASHGTAVVVVEDHFDDSVLDPAWSVLLKDVIAWTYSESGTELTVTDIEPAVVNPINVNGTWAQVMLNRTFDPLSDFSIDFDFSWDSLNDLGSDDVAAVQAVYIRLYDVFSNIIAEIGYYDLSAFRPGLSRIHWWDGDTREHYSFNQYLPAGSACVDVIRNGSNIEFFWDDVLQMSMTETAPLAGIDVEFAFYASERPTLFGTESLDFIRVEGTPLSPPPTEPNISAFPSSLDFGNVPCGTSSTMQITITNNGDEGLDIGHITKKGTEEDLFRMTDNNCSNQTLAPSGFCTLEVQFEPECPGQKQALLSIRSNDPDTSTLEVPVVGVAYPNITWIKDGADSPTLPGRIVYIYGHGFCKLRWVKLGKAKYRLDSGKIPYRTDEIIQFELPQYKKWVSGAVKSKNISVGTKTPEGILRSNGFTIDIRKP